MAKVSICLTLSKSCHAGKTLEKTLEQREEHWEAGNSLEEAIANAQNWLAHNRGMVLVSCHAWQGKDRMTLEIVQRKSGKTSQRRQAIPDNCKAIPAKVGDGIPSAIVTLIPGLSLSPAGYPLYHERRLFQRTDIPGTVVQLGTWRGVSLAIRKDGKASYSWLILHKPDKAPSHNVSGWHRQTHKKEAQVVVRRHKRPE